MSESFINALKRKGVRTTWLCVRTHWSDRAQIGNAWRWWRVWQ